MTTGDGHINFEFDDIYEKLGDVRKAQYLLAEQALKDSNFYIPKDTGALEVSSRIREDGEEISWNTPYARRLYYGVNFNFSTDVNPNARALWFEYAKARHMGDWLKIMGKVLP